MDSTQKQLTVYSWVGSQWAGVVHLGLAEKGFSKDEVDIKEIDLLKAENFEPGYLEKNPNGTVPTLTASHLSKPLVDTRQILEYLDQARPSVDGPNLTPSAAQDKAASNSLIELVHSSDLDSGLLVFGCFDDAGIQQLQASPFFDYLAARQTALEQYRCADPTNAFYEAKCGENGALHSLFNNAPNAARVAYFEDTAAKYKTFAAGLDKLERQIRLPYATGDHVTLADVHMVPWLSHVLFTLGTTDPSDFSKLDGQVQQVVPDFQLGPRVQEWWTNFGKRDSFQEVFSELH